MQVFRKTLFSTVLALFFALVLGACASRPRVLLTEGIASLESVAPDVQTSTQNAHELGFDIGASYAQVASLLASQGWTGHGDCDDVPEGSTCLADWVKGCEVTMLYLRHRDGQAEVWAVSNGQRFHCGQDN